MGGFFFFLGGGWGGGVKALAMRLLFNTALSFYFLPSF